VVADNAANIPWLLIVVPLDVLYSNHNNELREVSLRCTHALIVTTTTTILGIIRSLIKTTIRRIRYWIDNTDIPYYQGKKRGLLLFSLQEVMDWMSKDSHFIPFPKTHSSGYTLEYPQGS
jgi:hypothetical protein